MYNTARHTEARPSLRRWPSDDLFFWDDRPVMTFCLGWWSGDDLLFGLFLILCNQEAAGPPCAWCGAKTAPLPLLASTSGDAAFNMLNCYWTAACSASKKRQSEAGLMLGQRRRRWTGIKPTSDQNIYLLGYSAELGQCRLRWSSSGPI